MNSSSKVGENEGWALEDVDPNINALHGHRHPDG